MKSGKNLPDQTQYLDGPFFSVVATYYCGAAARWSDRYKPSSRQFVAARQRLCDPPDRFFALRWPGSKGKPSRVPRDHYTRSKRVTPLSRIFRAFEPEPGDPPVRITIRLEHFERLRTSGVSMCVFGSKKWKFVAR